MKTAGTIEDKLLRIQKDLTKMRDPLAPMTHYAAREAVDPASVLADACRNAHALLTAPAFTQADADRAAHILDDALLISAPGDVAQRVREARARLAAVQVRYRGNSWALADSRLKRAEAALRHEFPHTAATWLVVARDDLEDACL